MKSTTLRSLCLSLLLAFSPALSQTPDPGPQKELEQGELTDIPPPYVERLKAQGPFLELTLKDAIRLALINNLEIEIENYNEDLNRERIIQTRGFYDPILEMTLAWNSNTRPNTSILDAGQGIPTTIFKTWSLNSQFSQNVPGGGNLNLSFDNNRAVTNSTFSFINPQFGTNFRVRFTQPLWRGFMETATERQIKLFNLDSQISDSQFQQRVVEIIEQVEIQYWELVFAIENHEARRSSLELALVQYRNNQRRVEIGVMAPIEITSSRAEMATREQEMIQSEVQIINAQNRLKRLLAPDPQATLWDMSLIPTSRPAVQELVVNLQQAIETALERRPELDQIHLNLEKNDVDRSYYKKQGKPAVDLTFGLTSTGTAGSILETEFADTDGDGVPDTPVGQTPASDSPFFGNFTDSMGQSLGFDFLTYTAQISVQIPLRNRTNEAQMAQLAIGERQLMSQLKNQQQLILVDVRNAYEEIATQRKRLDAARVARQLSEEQLSGENKRFEAGLSTNFEVLRYQRDLVDAQVLQLRAMVDYQLALTALQKAMFTIVDEQEMVVAKRADTATAVAEP